ncbi:Expansin-B4 [Zea mays]|uniref:Uncharacterized protein n=1 Tax=Zea mays TaxID=4577 RepID=B4FIZ8_MAIZE|nr:Expansin-B4 [Zea mays]ACF82091.1 unknown [Zea mays]|eukprot:NP_001136518.1 Expansin-B4 [Zea mays]
MPSGDRVYVCTSVFPCRWCMRVPERRRPAAVLVHDRRRQSIHLPERQGLRRLLSGEMHRARVVLRQPGDRGPHRRVPRRRVPGRARALRPERHGVRSHGEGRPGGPAPRRRTPQDPVHSGAVQLARAGHRVQGGRRLEPELLRGAHRVRVRGRRAGVRGAHAARRRRRGGVGADAAVVGRGVAVQLRRHPAGALLRPPHLRLRRDGRRQQRHPRGVDARRHVPLGRQLRQLTRTDGRTEITARPPARPPAGRRDGRERRGAIAFSL